MTQGLAARFGAVVFGAAVLVGVAFPATAEAATAVTLSRAPYVTDLTTTGAYVDWAVEGQQTAGSVIVQPAVGGSCPSSIPWTSAAIPSPTTDPLVSGSSTSASWKITVNGVTEYQAETPVSGLSAATRYCYAVYSSDSSSAQELWPVQTFTTLSTPGSTAPVTFDVIGDTGENGTGFNQGQSNIYQEIGQSGAQFLLEAGDVSYTGGTETTYGDLQQSGAEVSNIFGPQYEPLAKGIPTFVADGNHGQTSDDLRIWPEPQSVAASQGVYSYGAPPAQVDGITSNSPSDWYAIQAGGVRIYVLDAAWSTSTGTATGSLCGSDASHCTGYEADAAEHWQTSSTEYQWLQKDLAAHPGGVKMAVFHYPVQSVNQTEVTDPYFGSLTSLLGANGVQVAFNGHAHTYQRFVPNGGGLTSFVTGGGGGTLQPVDGNSDSHGQCQAAIKANSVYAIGWSVSSAKGSACSNGNTVAAPTTANGGVLQVYNYLKVTVSGNVATVQAINALNQVFDTTTVTYAGTVDTQPPSVPTGLAQTTVTSSSVGLTWNPSTDNVGVTGYDVLRNGSKIGTTTTTSYTDPTVAPSTTYQYSVEAFDAAGNTSGPSTALPVTTPSGSPPPGVTFVQSAGSITKTVSLGTPAKAGDLLVLSASVYTGSTNHITAVSPDTWKLATDANSSGHNSDGEVWYTVATGGETSVTVSTGASNVALGLQEFSGLGTSPAVVATSASNTGTSASASASGTGLAVGFLAGHANGEAITPSGPFTSQGQQTTPTPIASVVDGYDLSAAGTVTYSGTFGTAMYWSAGVVIFS